MTKRIYLDNNASAQLDSRILDDIVQTLPRLQGNPSSSHYNGQMIRGMISKVRSEIAAYLKVKSSELIFTSGGTESVNMAIRGLISTKSPGHVITSVAEHACVIACCKALESQGFEVTYLPTGPWGAVLPESVFHAIRPNTQLITLMAVNNETGVKTDISSIAKMAKEHQIPFFVDAISQLGKEEVEIFEGISALAFSGHKIHALQGVGLLYLRSKIKVCPLILGGEHENGRRSGTENVLGILSLGKAFLLIDEDPGRFRDIQRIREKFESILTHHLDGLIINGEGPRTSNVSNIAFKGVDGETLLMALDSRGISASHGSACSSGSLEPSRVLLGMGLPLERVNSSIRFSFSRMNTLQEIETACQIIVECVRKQIKRS